jgi:hypothetical protein
MTYRVLLPFLFLAMLAGCTPEAPVDVPVMSKDDASAALLWSLVTNTSDFEAWPFWPGYEGLQPGQSPHGAFHEVYISPGLAVALPLGDRTAPAGSVIVKENYTGEKQVAGFSVMAKVPGYAPETGDWFWAMYRPDGTPAASGKLKGCIDCHAGMKDNDYVILAMLDAALPLERERRPVRDFFSALWERIRRVFAD